MLKAKTPRHLPKVEKVGFGSCGLFFPCDLNKKVWEYELCMSKYLSQCDDWKSWFWYIDIQHIWVIREVKIAWREVKAVWTTAEKWVLRGGCVLYQLGLHWALWWCTRQQYWETKHQAYLEFFHFITVQFLDCSFIGKLNPLYRLGNLPWIWFLLNHSDVA